MCSVAKSNSCLPKSASYLASHNIGFAKESRKATIIKEREGECVHVCMSTSVLLFPDM